MPELPEVETVCRQLRRRIYGKRILAGEIDDSKLSHINHLQAGEILNVERRGKIIVIDLKGGLSIKIHLRMTGRLLWQKNTEAPRHSRWRLSFPDGYLFLVDPRRFATVNIEETKKEKTKPVSARQEKRTAGDDHGWREDTVDLGSLEVKYVNYLAKIKKRILRIWKYPQKAYDNLEEGNVVVKMSIDASGRLTDVTLVSSSGSPDLDHGALTVVQEAAPYEPLPAQYNLSRLHIIASFSYKITD